MEINDKLSFLMTRKLFGLAQFYRAADRKITQDILNGHTDPGEFPILKCLLGHFDVDFVNDTELQFRDKILKAESCEDFVSFR